MLNPINKQIIPFQFKDINPLDENFKRVMYECNHILPNIVAKMNDIDNSIGKTYVIPQDKRAFFALPGANKLLVLKTRNKKSFSLKLTNVFLHVFESKIGFIELEWEYVNVLGDDYIEVNYFLNELKNDDNKIAYKIAKDEYKDFALKDCVQKILIYAFTEVSGFDCRGFNFQDLKPLSFTYVLLDNNDETAIRTSLTKAKNGYKESYKTKDLDLFIPFENSYWGASINGAINISCKTDDETTNQFFENNFASSFKNNYLLLMLMVLNQRFTLLKCINQISKKSLYTAKSNEEELRMVIKDIDKVIYKCELYNFRDYFIKASYVEHINQYYKYLRNSMNIEDYENELSRRVNSLKNVLNVYKNEFEMRKNKKDELRKISEQYHKLLTMHIILFVSQILAYLTSFKGIWDVVEKINGSSIRPDNPKFLWPILLSTIIFVTLLVKLIFDGIDLKKVKKKYDSLKNSDK